MYIGLDGVELSRRSTCVATEQAAASANNKRPTTRRRSTVAILAFQRVDQDFTSEQNVWHQNLLSAR